MMKNVVLLAAYSVLSDLLNHLARNSQLNGDGCGIGWYTDEGHQDVRRLLFLLTSHQIPGLQSLLLLLLHGTIRTLLD